MLHTPSSEVEVRAERRRVRRAWTFAKRCVAWGAFCVGASSISLPATSSAEDLALPAEVEAKLSGSVAAYDRTLHQRAGGKVVIAIVTNPADPDSLRAGSQLQAAFDGVDTISGLPHEEFVLAYKSAPLLAEACVQRNVSIVFLSTGLDRVILPIVQALESTRVLTIAGSLPYVSNGVVLGFDLVSGRPKLVINLTSARKQGLEFRAELLRLARVIE